eukprot:scaffold35722_cov32-Tisochrysis_lutea.AAC.3
MGSCYIFDVPPHPHLHPDLAQVRDSDSRLNPRERLAVEEWISSGFKIHSLRDHPNHDRPLNGGMWGGVKGAIADMEDLVQKWSNREAYMGEFSHMPKMEATVWTHRSASGQI